MGEEREKVPGSESVERPWASNDKLTYDNTMTHCNAVMKYSELALSQAVTFQQKSNDAYLAERDRREQQRLEQESAMFTQRQEHENEIETQRQENNRFSLLRLYGFAPEELEAIGIMSIAKAVADILGKKTEEGAPK